MTRGKKVQKIPLKIGCTPEPRYESAHAALAANVTLLSQLIRAGRANLFTDPPKR